MGQESGKAATARVRGVASSPQRGRKFAKSQIRLVSGMGVEGDAHFGPGNRQVSVLMVELALAAGIEPEPGDFAENLLVEGLDQAIALGSRLKVGSCVIEVAEIGKPEWRPGDYSHKGRAFLAEGGLFCRVLTGGVVWPGDEVAVMDI